MANEIRTLLNGVAGVIIDWKQDWKEDVLVDWVTDWTIDNFIAGAATAGANTGNGTANTVILNTRVAVAETWTLTATTATNFTVTGSVSGAKAALTVGTPYDNGFIALTITAGSTAFVADDTFTIAVSAVAMPVNTVAPVISDTTPQVGQALTVTSGTWTGTATITYTYEWVRSVDGAIVSTTNAYTCVDADLASTLTVTVRAENSYGTVEASSVATTAVAAA